MYCDFSFFCKIVTDCSANMLILLYFYRIILATTVASVFFFFCKSDFFFFLQSRLNMVYSKLFAASSCFRHTLAPAKAGVIIQLLHTTTGQINYPTDKKNTSGHRG